MARQARPLRITLDAAALIKVPDALQAKEEVDRLSQLTKDRSTLAFGSAMVCTLSGLPLWFPKGVHSLWSFLWGHSIGALTFVLVERGCGYMSMRTLYHLEWMCVSRRISTRRRINLRRS